MLKASRLMEVSTRAALQVGSFQARTPPERHPENVCPSGTNINDAMLMAVQLLETATREEQLPSGSVSLFLLLTDGDPTVGEGTAQL